MMKPERDRVMSSHPMLSSLAAFASAAVRPRTPLARAIVTVLAVKLVAVLAMLVFFSTQNAPVDAAVVDRLLGPSAQR